MPVVVKWGMRVPSCALERQRRWRWIIPCALSQYSCEDREHLGSLEIQTGALIAGETESTNP